MSGILSATTWTELESVMLSERSWRKTKPLMLSFTHAIEETKQISKGEKIREGQIKQQAQLIEQIDDYQRGGEGE